MCAIGANAQWIYDGETYTIDTKFYKDHCEKRNIDTVIRLNGPARSYNFTCWRKDTINDGSTQKFVYTLYTAYSPEYNIFLTKTGTLDELKQWFEKGWTVHTYQETLTIHGDYNVFESWKYMLDYDNIFIYDKSASSSYVNDGTVDYYYKFTYNL